jgi:hypothetical protein
MADLNSRRRSWNVCVVSLHNGRVFLPRTAAGAAAKYAQQCRAETDMSHANMRVDLLQEQGG